MRRQGTSSALVSVLGALAVLACPACDKRPSAGELARLREEVHKEDERARAMGELVLPRAPSVEVRTASAADRRVLGFDALDAMATDAIDTVGPAPDTGYRVSHRYRGVRLSRLVGDLDGGADDDFVIFGADGYWTSLRRDDVLSLPIVLAVERDGARITKSFGGPFLVALPLGDHPELANRYGEAAWCFYVSGIATGRPRPRLRIHGDVREPSFLASAGMVTRKQPVRFRLGWPSGDVTIVGPRLSDVVKRAGMPPGKVKIWSMGRGDADATIVTEEEMKTCDPLVVIGDAPDDRPVPLRMGGPALLAPRAECRAAWALKPWPAFLDTLEAVP